MNTQNTFPGASIIGEALIDAIRQAVRQEIQGLVNANDASSDRPQNPYLTVAEAAETARIAESTIRLYIRKGKLKASKVGRRVVIPRAELDKFLGMNPTRMIQ